MNSVIEEASFISKVISKVNKIDIQWHDTGYQDNVINCIMKITRKQTNQVILFKHTTGDIVSHWEYECEETLPYKLECKIDNLISEFDLNLI